MLHICSCSLKKTKQISGRLCKRTCFLFFLSQHSVSLVSMRSCLLRRRRSLAGRFCSVRSSKEDFVADKQAPAVVKSSSRPSSPRWEPLLVSSWMVAIRSPPALSGVGPEFRSGAGVLVLVASVARTWLCGCCWWMKGTVRPPEEEGGWRGLTMRTDADSRLLSTSWFWRGRTACEDGGKSQLCVTEVAPIPFLLHSV